MSKYIKLTSENLDEIRKDFDKALQDLKMSDGKITFTKNFSNVNRRAKLYFTELAYLKMLSLVGGFDKEVAWHGIAKRKDDEDDAYIIEDILVYPQQVTGATVNTDQEEYQMWLMSQPDEIFNNIRMQGHSHVNMGTTPSSVDLSLYERFLDQLEDDMFYIFIIWNKRNEKTIKIYDMKTNVLFETNDISVEVLDDLAVIKFFDDAKDLVKTQSYTIQSKAGGKETSISEKQSSVAKYKKKKEEDSTQKSSELSSNQTTIWDDDDDLRYGYKDYYGYYGNRYY